MFTLPVTTWYAAAHLLSAAVAAAVGLWVVRRTDVVGSRTFAALMAVDAAWVGAAAVELLSDDPAVVVAAAVVRGVLSLTAVVVWFRFASVYSGRREARRDPWTLAVVAGFAVLAALSLADASEVTVATGGPFVHAVSPQTPLGVAALLFSGAFIFGGVARLGSLFLRSRNRSSAAVLLLVATAVAATLPRVAAELGLVPVPTFDHTALGVGFFAVGAAAAVFGRGFLSVDPVARDVLFEELADPVVVVDGSGRLADYNAGARALCGRLRTGDAVGELYEEACPTLAAVAPLSSLGDDGPRDVTLVVDGGRRHYSVRAKTLSTGASVGRAVVFRDVTDLVAYRRELERQNEQLDQFAETVAHDLRNPLNAAQGYLDLVAADVVDAAEHLDPETAEAVRERFDTVSRTHGRMRDIVDDLGTLARKGKSVEETERLRLGEAAAAAWAGVGTEAATLSVVRDGEVVADRSRLLSVFENLFANSVLHAGPTVRVEVAATEGGFVVADDGDGVPAAERDRVFEYGYTTSRRGSGLGLAVVRTMAESHGWTVTVDGEYADGARFVFSGVVVTPDAEPAARSDGVDVAAADDGDDESAAAGT